MLTILSLVPALAFYLFNTFHNAMKTLALSVFILITLFFPSLPSSAIIAALKLSECNDAINIKLN